MAQQPVESLASVFCQNDLIPSLPERPLHHAARDWIVVRYKNSQRTVS